MKVRDVFLLFFLVVMCVQLHAQERTLKKVKIICGENNRNRKNNAETRIELKAGMKSPDFKYRDVNGKLISLKDLRGKYVLIDFWATWCGPCCMEIPHLKQLEKDLEGKNIVFVGISCDKDWNTWKSFVEKNQLVGIQLNVEGDKSFIKAYKANWIPRFVLLNKKGKIVNPDLWWPSSGVLYEFLIGLKGI